MNKILRSTLWIILLLIMPFFIIPCFGSQLHPHVVKTIKTSYKSINDIDLSEDNKTIIVSFDKKPIIELLSIKDSSRSYSFIGSGDDYNKVYFTPDNTVFYAANIKQNQDFEIEQFNTINYNHSLYRTQNALTSFQIASIDPTLEPNTILVTKLFPPIISKWNIQTDQKVSIIKDYSISKFLYSKLDVKTNQIAINYINGDSKGIYIWDVLKNKKLQTLKSVSLQVDSLGFSNSSKQLVIAGEGQAMISDISTGKKLLSLERSNAQFNAIFFNYNDQYILSLSYASHILQIWNASTGSLVYRLKGNFSDLAVSHTSNMFITSNQNGTIKIWNLNRNMYDKRTKESIHKCIRKKMNHNIDSR